MCQRYFLIHLFPSACDVNTLFSFIFLNWESVITMQLKIVDVAKLHLGLIKGELACLSSLL